MPHKHKRKRDDDKSNFDLDPSLQAKPLPAYKPASVFSSEPSNKRRKSSANKTQGKVTDDTPKAFARMMAWQAAGKRPSGLDDGAPKVVPKKGKSQKSKAPSAVPDMQHLNTLTSESITTDVPSNPKEKTPQILPGESLSAFALRVDQSLPLSSVSKSSTNKPVIPSDIKPKARITKHNRRLQRLIADWRTTDAKRKEKQEEDDDDIEDKREEEDLLWDGVRLAKSNRKGKKKTKHSSTPNNDDPWRDLEKRRRNETKQKNLQDVVSAPPSLVKVRSRFKMRDEDLSTLSGAKSQRDTIDDDVVGVDVKDVPNAVGSLRRREEMGQKRREIIDGYRKMRGRKLKGKGLSPSLSRTVMT